MRRSTRRQRSSSERERPRHVRGLSATLARGNDRLDRALAHVLDGGQAEADRLRGAGRIGLDGEERLGCLHVGRADRDPQPPALGHHRGHLLGALPEAIQDGGHELDRVVGLEVGGLVRDQPVAGGVGLVEPVAGEWLEGGEDLVDHRGGDPLLLGAGLELRLVLAQDRFLLLADRVAEVVRLGPGVIGHGDGGGHDVFLVDEDPVRVVEGGLERRVQVGDRLLPVLAADVGGDVGHRAGAEERDHGRQVLHLGRLEVLHVAAHPRALELEDAGRLPGREQLEGLRVVQRQLVDVDLHAPVHADQVDGIGQDGQVDEAQEVELEEAQRLAGVHLELGHGGAAVGRALERHDLGQRLAADHDPGGMRGGMARHPLQLLGDADQLLDPLVPGDQLAQLRRGVDRALEADVQLVGDRLRDPVGLRVGQPHGAARRRGSPPWRPASRR